MDSRTDSSETASEIEFGIVGNRRLPRYAIGEQTAEAGPRFQPVIPFGKRRELVPRNLAVIIQRRQMRRERKVGERHLPPCQIAPRFGKRAEPWKRCA